jgi:hypothetical protein
MALGTAAHFELLLWTLSANGMRPKRHLLPGRDVDVLFSVGMEARDSKSSYKKQATLALLNHSLLFSAVQRNSACQAQVSSWFREILRRRRPSGVWSMDSHCGGATEGGSKPERRGQRHRRTSPASAET